MFIKQTNPAQQQPFTPKKSFKSQVWVPSLSIKYAFQLFCAAIETEQEFI